MQNKIKFILEIIEKHATNAKLAKVRATYKAGFATQSQQGWCWVDENSAVGETAEVMLSSVSTKEITTEKGIAKQLVLVP